MEGDLRVALPEWKVVNHYKTAKTRFSTFQSCLEYF